MTSPASYGTDYYIKGYPGRPPAGHDPRFERALATISALAAERGVGRHALFHEINRRTPLPDGSEVMSGRLVDEQGRLFAFETGWDAERGEAAFARWESIEPDPSWDWCGEYQQARAEVGLRPPLRTEGVLLPPPPVSRPWPRVAALVSAIFAILLVYAVMSRRRWSRP